MRDEALLKEREVSERAKRINAALEVMTHPRSIAVIGAKRPANESFPGMFKCIRDFGFSGKLYPINPHVTEIYGYNAYPDLFSLPEPVDLVIICLPAQSVPEALKDCVASGNRNVHIFTAGFKETGEEEGIRLQEEMESIARHGGLNVVGPNSMGFYVPESRMVTWPGAPRGSGPVGFISQSGSYAQELTHYAAAHFGLHASKVISYGNGMLLDSTDFLEYLAQDDETRIIGMYLEGVKDGRRLLKLITEINLKKPVIIMKGGVTESGARAAVTHTGVLAGGVKSWDAFFRQSGAVRVGSMEEMAEVALALLHLGESRGRRLAVLGAGGGISVTTADECSKAGLELPVLPPELMRNLRGFIPVAGNMIRNPIDALPVFADLHLLGRMLDLLSEASIDMFMISLALDWVYDHCNQDGARLEEIATYIAKEARKHTKGKPLVVAWRQYVNMPDIRRWPAIIGEILLKDGIPFYHGLPKAIFVLSKLAQYHESLRRKK